MMKCALAIRAILASLKSCRMRLKVSEWTGNYSGGGLDEVTKGSMNERQILKVN